MLADYGTGAVMGVPAHDQRDFVFARQYELPVKRVIVPEGAHEEAYDGGAWTGGGAWSIPAPLTASMRLKPVPGS